MIARSSGFATSIKSARQKRAKVKITRFKQHYTTHPRRPTSWGCPSAARRCRRPSSSWSLGRPKRTQVVRKVTSQFKGLMVDFIAIFHYRSRLKINPDTLKSDAKWFFERQTFRKSSYCESKSGLWRWISAQKARPSFQLLKNVISAMCHNN